MNPAHAPPPVKRKRQLRLGLIASLVFHLGVVVVLLIYRPWQGEESSEKPDPSSSTSSSTRRQSPADIPASPKPQPPIRSFDEVGPKVHETMAQAEQRSDEDNLDELGKQIERLDELSSEASIDRLSGRFQQWLGTKQRADSPAETPVAGEFDHDSAQLFEVRRQPGPDGSWSYPCVLLDAEGRTMETELKGADGERAYRTMRLLKVSPLAEKVYRQITLPLMDKMLDDGSSKDAPTSRPPQAETSTVPVDETGP